MPSVAQRAKEGCWDWLRATQDESCQIAKQGVYPGNRSRPWGPLRERTLKPMPIAITLGTAALLVAAVPCSGADRPYEAEIGTWRQDFDADLRNGAWLALVGRYRLGEGEFAVGSDPSSDVVLPERAPKSFGRLTRHSSTVRFEPARGAEVSVDGMAVSAGVELSTKSGTGWVRRGDFQLAVRPVGEDYYVLVQDSGNPLKRNFKGSTWFPVDPSFRVPAKFLAYAHPEKVALALTHVDSRQYLESDGDVVFELGGRQWRLKSFAEEDHLFLMFQDGTNGKATYGGGRFLYAPIPKDGTTVLDFNKAFNPYCSVNDAVMCPIPLPGSRLEVDVTAGETYRGHD